MKRNEIKVGSVYAMKVSGRLCKVRVDRECESLPACRGTNYDGTRKWTTRHGGWIGTNLHTNRGVRIKTAAKLRKELVEGVKQDTATTVQLARIDWDQKKSVNNPLPKTTDEFLQTVRDMLK